MLLLLRFFYVFTFFQNPKSRDFLRFLPCFVRFLELWFQFAFNACHICNSRCGTANEYCLYWKRNKV